MALLAKLSRPRLPQVVARTRLFALLDANRTRRVVWALGLPGAGKTTAVASYLDARRLRSLWYQVDEGDRRPRTFFHYLGLAAGELAPRKRGLPPLTPEYLAGGVGTFARHWFRELGTRCGAPFALVFDNYQEVPPESPFHVVVSRGEHRVPSPRCAPVE